MRLVGKKGLSPIIATVLLIALAMILAMIIFLWARGWIAEQIEKRGKPIDQVCENVQIRVSSEKQGNILLLSVVNNGQIPINSIEVMQESEGSIQAMVFNTSIAPTRTSGEIRVVLNQGVTKLVVYPQLLGNVKGKVDNRITTCLNRGKTVSL